MPLEFHWLLEGQIILHHNIGDITEDDMLQGDDPLNRLLDAATSPLVHVIVLTAQQGKMPKSVSSFTQASWTRHPRLGWTVIVGLQDPILRFIASTAGQIFKMRMKFVETPQDALTFLQYVDSTLPQTLTMPI
ncbi:MAG: hypothetical protein ACOYL5_18055 [Phototrophicaceae bacterium]|jgi:hypothetical protein